MVTPVASLSRATEMWKNVKALEEENKRLRKELEEWVKKALELSEKCMPAELPWRSTQSRKCTRVSKVPALHSGASPQLKQARALLALLPRLDEQQMTRAFHKLRQTCPVEGNRACSWLLNVLASQAPPGRDRIFLREQADIVMEDCCVSRRLREGWQQYGLPSVYDVLEHPSFPRQVPRFHSAP